MNAADGTPHIALSGTIPAGGYFLLERTDDGSVPGVTADQIYTGALGNAGEVLALRDGGAVLHDSVDAWYAGNNTTKATIVIEDKGIVSPAEAVINVNRPGGRHSDELGLDLGLRSASAHGRLQGCPTVRVPSRRSHGYQ